MVDGRKSINKVDHGSGYYTDQTLVHIAFAAMFAATFTSSFSKQYLDSPNFSVIKGLPLYRISSMILYFNIVNQYL